MDGLLIALKHEGPYDFDISIQEIRQLAHACDITITETIIQETEIHKATFIGKGKLQEAAIRSADHDCVIVNEALTPLQMRNICDVIDVMVLDRNDLILRIFKQRAKTKEAILQVEIARLNYELPRLAGAHSEIYAQQGGHGFRGAGEQQIELERRQIHRRLTQAKKQLIKVRKNRQTQRKRRSDKKCVALVGYTNSGKSSLLNLFTSKKVESRDMLFATLQTATRRVRLDQTEVLMTDTVGFISQLPHELIEAFKSTLEEVREADLIVLVIDVSSPYIEEQIEVTQGVLKELGVSKTPLLYVYNKIDLPHDSILTREPHVMISVRQHWGIDCLEREILRMLQQDAQTLSLMIPYEEGDIYAHLHHDYQVIKEEFDEKGILMVIKAPAAAAEIYKKYSVRDVSDDNI